jgi:hypothetical protein
MATDSDEFDDFFDTPRPRSVKNENGRLKSVDETRHVFDFRPTNAKPPAHPNSRPTSAASSQQTSSSGRASAPLKQGSTADDDIEHRNTRRVIEAKVPTASTVNVDDDEYVYSDDPDDQSSTVSYDDHYSGRRAPVLQYRKSSDSGEFLEGKFQPLDSRSLETKYESTKKHSRGGLPEKLSLPDDSDSCCDDLVDSSDDSEVTDVSPLGTPHVFPPGDHTKNYCPPKSGPEKSCLRSTQPAQRASRTKGNFLQANSDTLDLAKLLQTVLEMESHTEKPSSGTRNGCMHTVAPPNASRRNYSFTNDQVRAIEQENQRLMKSLMRHAAEAKKMKRHVVKSATPLSRMPKRPASAAINRAKQMQKIEAENLILLRKLQQTRPSNELRRDALVSDFERLSGGGGGANCSTRPLPGYVLGHSSRLGSGKRVRPHSSYSRGESRPPTAFPTKPDDDDILTWQPKY